MMDTEALRTYMLSGKAVFTVKSLASGGHFTYRVSAIKGEQDKFFMSLLTGADNTRDYTYLGLLTVASDGRMTLRHTAKSCASEEASSFTAARWTVGMVNRGLSFEGKAEVRHEGRCGRCARVLTHPESLKTGLGPECATRVA